jgi:thiol-disulfide isomerase/thioredoxin
MLEVVRLLLAAVLATAGVAKLLDLPGSRRAVRAFGAPEWSVPLVATALPIVELLVAAALVPAATARAAAGVAAGLLLAFAVVVAIARLRGRTPECHCFGKLGAARAGWQTVARNLGLAAVAFAVAAGPAGAIERDEAAAAAAIALIAAQALVLLVLLRRYGRALARLEALEPGGPPPRGPVRGAVAPPFALDDVQGDRLSLAGLVGLGRPVLLLFTSTGCGACLTLMPRAAEWQRRAGLTVALVASGDRAETAAVAAEHGLALVLVEEEHEAAGLYGVEATPSAVLVARDGTIAHELVAGVAAVEELVGSTAPAVSDENTDREVPEAPVPARVVAGATLAGAAAVAAATARRASAARTADPELAAVGDTIRASQARLLAAARRSQKAIAAISPAPTAAARRTRRSAANALVAERSMVLSLRAQLQALDSSGSSANNARAMAVTGLDYLARSLDDRRKALVAQPKPALALLDEAQTLATESLVWLANASKVIGGAA